MMAAMEPLLIELGTEELPVKALPGLAQAFFDGVIDGLAKRGIAFDRGDAQAAVLAAPPGGAAAGRRRRTARTAQRSARPVPQHRARCRRPADPGAAGFRAEGRRRLDRAGTHQRRQGRAFRPSRGEAGREDRRRCCPRSCARRSPRCRSPSRCAGASTNMRFARPVHWLVLLLGKDVVDGEVLGVRAGRNARGHRFQHDKPVWIDAPGDYVDALRGANVLVDPDERRDAHRARSRSRGRAGRRHRAHRRRQPRAGRRAWSNGRARCSAASRPSSWPCRRKR